jgi:hypothetical protein
MTTRYIVDHLNAGDLIGAGIPDAPIGDGLTYGRGGREWYPVLPLAGGRLTNTLVLPDGTVAEPSLAFGARDGTGMGRSGQALALSIQSQLLLAVFTTGAQFYQPLSMLNNRITAVADAAGAADALNLRSAEARYGHAPWTSFPVDPGWTDSSLRTRLVDGGASLQFDGYVGAPLPANARARLGVLPEDMRPTRMHRIPATLAGGINLVGLAVVEIGPDGMVWTTWTLDGTANTLLLSVNAIVAMD